MTLLACQIFSTIAHEGSFARTAEQLHLTPSAISHAVSTMEAECGFPLFTRTKSGVTMTAAAENLLPAIQRLLASSESLDLSLIHICPACCCISSTIPWRFSAYICANMRRSSLPWCMS